MVHNPLVQQAIDDLAQRQAVAPSAIKVVSFEAVTWRDSSLGCPQPGMRYKQVLQDGARIILRLAQREYAYHSGGNRAPFLCTRPAKAPVALEPPGDPRT